MLIGLMIRSYSTQRKTVQTQTPGALEEGTVPALESVGVDAFGATDMELEEKDNVEA